MKTVFLCCTYYQLIVSIQIRQTMYKDAEAYLLLSDDSKGYDLIAAKLTETHLFNDVLTVPKRKMLDMSSSLKDKIVHVCYSLYGCGKIKQIAQKKIDAFLFFNDDTYTSWLYAELSRANPKLQNIRFEEGFISYYIPQQQTDTLYMYTTQKLRKILGKPVFFGSMKEFLCFFPSLYKGELLPVQIPRISPDDKILTDQLAHIFNVQKEKLNYRQYIYFTSTMHAEITGATEEGELNIIKSLADIVGQENITIKKHPRDKTCIYNSYHNAANSSVPFEVIQLIHGFEGHVFLTTLSGAVLTVSSIIDNPPPIIFTYKMYVPKEMEYLKKWGPLYEELSEKLMTEHKGLKIYFPQNEQELKDILTQLAAIASEPVRNRT